MCRDDGRVRGGQAASPPANDARRPGVAILSAVEPFDRLRAAGQRVIDPAESLAQRVAERVVDLLVHALDVNALAQLVDLNALLDQVDVDKLLTRVNVNALLAQVDVNVLLARVDLDAVMRRVDVGTLVDQIDVNDLARRVDMDVLVEETDLGALIARSSGGAATEALDAARSQAVGLDQFVDRWADRLLRRKRDTPSAPAAVVNAPAGS